jgi:hypothetical protein
MARVWIQGLAIAIAGIVALALNRVLDLGTISILFGLLIGGAVGISKDGSALGRTVGFLVGVIAGVAYYGIRLLVLNDSFVGQVVMLLLVIAVLTLICALTSGWIPLMSGLLGAGLSIGALEGVYQNDTTLFLSVAPTNVGASLLPAALGLLAGVLVGNYRRSHDDPSPPAEPSPTPEQPTVSLTKSEG